MKYLLFTLATILAAAPAQAAPRLCPPDILNVFKGGTFNYCPPGANPARIRPERRRRAVEWTTESCRRAGGTLDEGTGSCTQY